MRVDDIDRARSALDEHYEASLTKRLAAVEGWQDSFDVDDIDQVAEARRLGHQLSGSAASFGFPALGDLGGTVEHATTGELVALLGSLADEIRGVLAILRSRQRPAT